MKDQAAPTQWFDPTGGRVSGWSGLVAAVVIVIAGIVGGSAGVVVTGALIGLLAWMVLLRPRVGLRGRTLLLRGVLSTTEIPLGVVTSMTIRQFLVVWIDETRYTNVSLGRPLREVRPKRGEEVPPDPYLEHLMELIRAHQADAKRWGDDTDGVRRSWARPEIGAAAVLAVAAVVFVAL